MNTDTPVQPHNRDAEEALLGALLIDPGAYPEISGFLQGDDFYIHRHRFIWEALGRLNRSGCPVDFVTLSDELERAGRLAEIGGPAYLSALIGSSPTSQHAEAYARIVEQAAVRRRMLQAASEVARLAHQPEPDLDGLLGQAEQALRQVAGRRQETPARPVGEILSGLFNPDGSPVSGKPANSGLPTGFPALDRVLGGLRPGEMQIVAGRPGMGKTAFLLSVVRNIALAQNRRVLFFSLEMDSAPIVQRLAAQQSGIEADRLRDGLYSPAEQPVLGRAVQALHDLPILIDETPALSVQQLAQRCRRQPGLDLVVVDYLQLLTGGGRSENRTQEVGLVARQLKTLARELHLPLLAAAQLSRSVEQRLDKRPLLSDLRESGGIEQEADVVIFLHRLENASPVEVTVAKHRNGPVGQVQLRFRPELTRFDNP